MTLTRNFYIIYKYSVFVVIDLTKKKLNSVLIINNYKRFRPWQKESKRCGNSHTNSVRVQCEQNALIELQLYI